MPIVLLRPTSLDDDRLRAVRGLIAASAAATGRDPLSDQAVTRLTSAGVEHVVVVDHDETVIGYGQLDGRSLEIVAAAEVAPRVLHAFDGRSVLVWSHGTGSPLVDALDAAGFDRARELHQLRRPLEDRIDVPPPPDGVEIRAFVPGADEEAWRAVNAAAFAHHPEQGEWALDDLLARERESWFDPSGFLMAWRGADLVGYHWTKIHPDGAGEVYVIGVDPSTQGSGLGTVLLLAGLRWLQDHGCAEVLLYVDGDNTGAMHLYERRGFVRHDLDVQWARGAQSTGSESNT